MWHNSKAFDSGRRLANPPTGDEIVISGISGAFPESRNVYHFRDNLYNKVDMVTSDQRRWVCDNPEVPSRIGKVFDIQKFDAGFFGTHFRQAQAMDPSSRIVLEKAVEAVLDAGLHPSELEGTKTGVYIGTCFSESEKTWYFDKLIKQHFIITGNLRSMMAHRISYFFKLNGPSHIIDTACSSSLYALEHAYKAFRCGEIDMAIVGGCNTLIYPMVSLQFARLGVLSKDGVCKVFDEKADGYARSEAVACIFLQRAKDCRRMYSEVVHAKSSCDGYKPQSITYPSGEAQKLLLQDFYQDCGENLTNLSFLEAHGTGTVVGDPEELQAIDEVFCKGRTTPLLIGSVKSNIGHTEPSSGLCSITKVVIAMENGLIPPNIYYQKPRSGVEALEKGRVKVVTEKMRFEDDRGLIAVNSFGFGGGNAHVLLRWNNKIKSDQGIPKDDLPRLVCVSGRNKSSVNLILDDLKNRTLDAEYVKLLHKIFNKNTKGYLYRSYSIVAKSGELKRSSSYFNIQKKPLCLAFTNFGKSWSQIANQFYAFPQFGSSIQRIHNILLCKNVNLLEIIYNGSQSDLDDTIGTMTLQIAIVDIFKVLEVQPDYYFGLNYGEIICDYMEGYLSLEETVLFIYHAKENSKPVEKKHTKSFKRSNLTDLRNDTIVLEIGLQGLDILNKHHLLSFNKTDFTLVNFLELLGKLYQVGHTFFIERLYPQVEFPVSRSTPMISPLIKWDHRKDWFVVRYENFVLKTGKRLFAASLLGEETNYLKGHTIDDRQLYPATGYLVLAWETFCIMTGKMPNEVQIIVENCKFLRATTVPKEAKLTLLVSVQRGSGDFEIVDNSTVVASGRIKAITKGSDKDLPLPTKMNFGKTIPLKTKDIYKELRLRGYNYTGKFKKILKCDGGINQALIKWDANWITFLDAMLQLTILKNDTRGLFVPVGIRSIKIDGKKHIEYVQSFGENPELPVYVNEESNMISCGGIEIQGLNASSIVRRKQRSKPVLEKHVFVPNEAVLTVEDSLRVVTQIILENLAGYKIKTVEEVANDSEPLSPIIHEALSDLPLIQPSVTLLTKREITIPNVTVEDKKLITETDCTLVVGSNLLQSIKVLMQALIAVKENGFVLSRETLDFETKSTNCFDVEILTVHRVDKEKFYLLRRKTSFVSTAVVKITNTNDEFSWLPVLQKAVHNNPSVVVVAENEPLSGILGLVSCIRREPAFVDVKTVFTFDGAPVFDLNNLFYSSQLRKNLAVNVYKNSSWGTYRFLLLDKSNEIISEHVFCNTLVRGDLSSLRWLEGPLSYDTVLPPEKVMIYVYNASLNFRDVMCASGKISVDVIDPDRTRQEFVHGFEFSGKTKDGKRVMGMVAGALSTILPADRYLVWPCPDFWSLEEAATIPVVYSTVYYSFFIRCHIKKGQSILIHAGSGGVGQAAINTALHHGLTVYTTVGTKEKRELIKKTFPQLTDGQIGNSRDTSFEQMIYTQTNGRGVDYVLNSLAEDKLLASIRCLVTGGHFMEIGKFDLAMDNVLRLKLLGKSATFHGIMLDGLFSADPRSKRKLHKLLLKDIQNGTIKPLVKTTFKMDQIEEAFRYMAGGKHVGKVIIQVRKEENKNTAIPTRKFFKGLPRFFCNSDNVYIIIGGLGGFGLELADWLVLRGARHLVLNSRKGVSTGYQSYRIKIWKSYGTRVHISNADVTTRQGCQQLIEEASCFGDVESIFNLAVVLKDGLFENQTVDDFRQSLAPKAIATKHLDEITRELCPKLRDFVIFSSVSCGRGNAGQSNYGMANSIMERICEKRKDDGYPAIAIEWGAIGDVGLVAELQEEHTEMEISGTLQQRISSCLQVLDTLLAQRNAIVSSMVVAEKRGLGGADNIVDAVAQILGLGDLKTVSLHASLSELGMDSMTAVEIKQTLEREYEVFLTPHDVRNLTLARLVEIREETASEDESVKKDRAIGGFEMIVRLMTEEETSKIPVVRLRSKTESYTDPNVIFFPGIEGVAKVLAPLAVNLNGNVHCLQFIPHKQSDTITKMAETLLPIIESLISKSAPFNILAYSFGTVVAFEVVSLLEAKGYTGTIFAIDGAPHMLEIFLKTYLNLQSEAIFETGFIMRCMSLYMPVELVSKTRKKLLTCSTFEDRMNILEQVIPKNTTHSVQYLKEFAKTTYLRLKALSNYEFVYPKLKSKVKLFKPQNTSINGLDEDYKLSEICENPVEVKVFKGNHVTILENVELAEAINSSLDLKPSFINSER